MSKEEVHDMFDINELLTAFFGPPLEDLDITDERGEREL
jgi:hypothetical protein